MLGHLVSFQEELLSFYLDPIAIPVLLLEKRGMENAISASNHHVNIMWVKAVAGNKLKLIWKTEFRAKHESDSSSVLCAVILHQENFDVWDPSPEGF